MSWDSLPQTQQQIMDDVIRSLNKLSTSLGDEDVCVQAHFVLGVLYENGRGMAAPKFSRAAEMYTYAAAGGCKEAMYNLASLTRTGAEGVQQDAPLAFAMYETAALEGHVKAAYNVAVMYSNGEGVDRNQYKAEEWFLFAAKHGHKEAEKNSKVLERKNTIILVLIVISALLISTGAIWALMNSFESI